MDTVIKDIEQVIGKSDREFQYYYPYQLVDEWAEQLESDSFKLTTGFPSIDRQLRGKLRGKIAAYIGYGGTKKSLAGLKCIHENTLNGARGLNSVMEMPGHQQLERLIDINFDDPLGSRNPNEYFEDDYVNGQKKETVKHLKDKLKKTYGDRLAITQNRRMAIEDYQALIKKYREENGANPDILVIDGLSMMDSKGMSETEAYTTNSGQLKDLAVEENIFIVIICHCSRGEGLHQRELQHKVRGSEKILDNVDFILMFSLCLDEEKATEKTPEYLEEYGYIRYYGKRVKGKRINLIYHFDRQHLTMTETDRDPVEFEVKPKSSFGT